MWLQWGLYILIGLFEWFGIITNMQKMVTMVCQSGTTSRQKYAASYGWWMTREGYPKHVKQRQNLVWGECGAELDVEYMTAQLHMQHSWKGQAEPIQHPLPILTQN